MKFPFHIGEKDASPMFARLQRKFIFLNLITVAVVLVAAFAGICFLSYQQDLAHVQGSLSRALDKAIKGADEIEDGSDADADDPGDPSPDDSSSSSSANTSSSTASGSSSSSTSSSSSSSSSNSSSSSSSSSSSQNKQIGRIEIGPNTDNIVAVAVYKLSDDGFEEITNFTTAELSSESTIEQAEREVAAADDGAGVLKDLSVYYEKRTTEDGTSYVAFASTDEASGWEQLAMNLTGVGVLVMLIFFIISVYFSRWALRPVKESWIQQKRFVADASHDLKTPLTVILANSSILMEHPEKSIASQSQWIESTENEAKQMQEMVNDLLLLAKLDEGVTQAARDDVDFSTLVEGELLEFESVAFESGITLESDIAEDLHVLGDRSRLRRLITTLLDNACKYTQPGHAVRARLERVENKKLRFAVNNTGTTIDQEDLAHVFDRFYRADKSRTNTSDVSSSHGLGLAIAHAIAEEHGGTLTAKSSLEEGTTFIAELPLK
ncbi:MAG: sensor histidine kinase [Eggerthellaceae bacterium]|jgi:signal transduction histidine kinase